jgi:hypothetical protein
MPPIHRLTAVFIAVPVMAQSGWSDYLKHWVAAKPYRTAWTLLVRKGDRPEGWHRRDEGLLRLWADGDLVLETLDGPAAASLAAARGWSSTPHWLLLGPGGRDLAEGEGTPTGDAVLETLRTSGWVPVGEARGAFLREHPGNGPALDAELLSALRLARQRYSRLVAEGKATRSILLREPGRLNVDPDQEPVVADAIFLEVARAVDGLLALPDFERAENLSAFRLVLDMADGSASPRLRSTLLRLREQVLQAWIQSPHAGGDWAQADEGGALLGLGFLWATAETTLEPRQVPRLPAFELVPGERWPKWDLLQFLMERALVWKDWRGLLDALQSVPETLPEGTLTEAQWKDHRDLRAHLATLRTRAHALLGEWDLARQDLVEARRWSGSRWMELSLAEAFQAQDKPVPEAPQAWLAPIPAPADFLELVNLPPEADLPNPSPIRPIRMVRLAKASWESAWKGFASDPALTPWGTDELRWTLATPAETALLASLDGAPTWAAMQGEDLVLAAGREAPVVRNLVLALGVAGPTRLQRLDAFIRRHPDHLDARRARFDLCRPRLPNPALEARVAEDAAKAHLDPGLASDGAWNPDPALWQPLALRVRPELEAALERWPASKELWRAWLGWNALAATPRSAWGWAQGLAIYGSRPAWMARLPLELHAAVARELAQRPAQARDWFAAAWAGLLPQLDDAAFQDRAAHVEAIHRHLAAALRALNARDELAELERQRAGLKLPGR